MYEVQQPVIELSDYAGHENLELVSQSNRFISWIYGEILPVLQGDVLEVGSGLGVLSEKIISDLPCAKITLTDASLNYVRLLQEKFSNANNISIHGLDLNCKTDYERTGYEKFDSIVAINVLEHIENDEFALQELRKLLKKGGILIVLVPCHKFLYNVIDRSIGHYRRYTKKDLERKAANAQLSIERMSYFNALGIIGWYINGNLGKNPKINARAYKLFDKMIPLIRYSEKITGKKIGLSLICCLKKM
jgi:2-polyprenyl-3-methyl-5-hydroxy-6-metoxy-1,4-benzoquinol methylase